MVQVTATEHGELVEFSNGTACYYVDDNHSYWRARKSKTGDGRWVRGRRLTGVTTAIKPIDFDPGKLLDWAARQQCLGIAELVGPALVSSELNPDDLQWLTSQEGIIRELKRSELTWEHIRNRAGTRGTKVHELALKALAQGQATPDFDQFTEDERGYAHAVVEWWLDHDPEPLQVEQVVLSEELGVAGRFDLRAKIGGKTALVDAKTGKWVGEKDHVQLAAYDYIARECGIGPSDELSVLKLEPDGSYELVPSEATHEDFLAAVDMYRRRGRIGGKARDAWRERQGEGI